MGEYFEWVNVDKKELIGPHEFNLGHKLIESAHDGNLLLNALYELLLTDWAGDALVFLGDETDIPDDIENDTLRRLHAQRIKWGEAGYDADYVFEEYHNIAGTFKGTEEDLCNEIRLRFEWNDWGVNEYRINPKDPFKGLFVRSGSAARFVINETKKEYYDSQKTMWPEEFCSAGSHPGFNPLPLLFAFGRSAEGRGAKVGDWIGDVVTVSDEEPDLDYCDISGNWCECD